MTVIITILLECTFTSSMVICWRGWMKVLSTAVKRKKGRKFIHHLQEIILTTKMVLLRKAPNPYDEEEVLKVARRKQTKIEDFATSMGERKYMLKPKENKLKKYRQQKLGEKNEIRMKFQKAFVGVQLGRVEQQKGEKKKEIEKQEEGKNNTNC